MSGRVKIKPRRDELDELIEFLNEQNKVIVGFEELEKELQIELYNRDIEGWKKLIVEIGNEREYFFVREKLLNALMDPSDKDTEILRTGYQNLRDYLKEKRIDPNSTMLSRRIMNSYISSLLMRLIVFPTEELNGETLKEMKIYDEEIGRLYAGAIVAAFGSGSNNPPQVSEYVDKLQGGIGRTVTLTSKVERIKIYEKRCYVGSHYVLRTNIEKLQEKANKEAVVTEEYKGIEDKIVKKIKGNFQDLCENDVRNLVRLYLNLVQGYKIGNPLPLVID